MECRLSEWVAMALVEHPYREVLVNPGGGMRRHRKLSADLIEIAESRLPLLYKHAIHGRGIALGGVGWRQSLSCCSMEQYCSTVSLRSLGVSISKEKWALLCRGQLALSHVVLLHLLQTNRTTEPCGGGWACLTHGTNNKSTLSAHCCRNTCQPSAQRIQSCCED